MAEKKREGEEQPDGTASSEESSPFQAEPEDKAPAWEAELDRYPLRSPEEDPPWAVRTVGCWVICALASLAFILLLIVLGAFYD